MKTYYVYIVASASRALYAGVTNNLERRIEEHRAGRIPGFSARYSTRELVYFEIFGEIRAAIAREKQIKGWVRAKKVVLIESANPSWKDLGICLRTRASYGEPGVICHSERSGGARILRTAFGTRRHAVEEFLCKGTQRAGRLSD